MAEYGKRRMPPSLTSDELREIQAWERSNPSPVVRRLLWEIFRLRAIALTARQYEEMTRRPGNSTESLIGQSLRDSLNELPLIQERMESVRETLVGHGETKKPRGIDNH